MATGRKKTTKTKRDRVGKASRASSQKPKTNADHNERRRRLYHSDERHRQRLLKQQRDAYNEGKDPSPLQDGILRDGVMREVKMEGLDTPLVLECFTIRETAEALGKTWLTLRDWIKKEIVPEPICEETATVSRYKQYVRFEVEALAEVLAEHQKTSDYITSNDLQTIANFEGALRGARQAFISGCDFN